MVIDESNIRRSVFRLSLPSVAEQALIMVVGVVSTIFVGHISKEAISAVGLINTLSNFIIALFVALSTGCTVLVARLVGEENISSARDVVRQSVVLGAAASLLLSVICYIFAVPIIKLFFSNADSEVIRIADMYFKIALYTFPLMLINIIISGSLRGAGDTKTPMVIAYIVNMVNVALNFVLIFGVDFLSLHLKGHGITGAAYAVSISRGLGGVLSLSALYMPRNVIRVNILEKFRADIDVIKRIFNVGIPAALEQIVMQGGFLALQVVIAGMGTTAIAVYQIGMSVNSICYMPILGFGIAATTLVGQSLGARKPQLAEKSGWETQKITLIITVALTIVILIFAKPLVMAYTQDTEVIKTGTLAIRVFSFSQPFLAIVIVLSGALRGAGDIRYVMVTSFVGIWVFRILLTLLFNRLFGIGIMGVWYALFLDYFIRSMMYIFRFKRGGWKEIVI